MGSYRASAKVILTFEIDCQGEGDIEALADANASVLSTMEKVKSGELSLHDLVYMQDVSMENLRRIG
jgi:hypothetical protein